MVTPVWASRDAEQRKKLSFWQSLLQAPEQTFTMLGAIGTTPFRPSPDPEKSFYQRFVREWLPPKFLPGGEEYEAYKQWREEGQPETTIPFLPSWREWDELLGLAPRREGFEPAKLGLAEQVEFLPFMFLGGGAPKTLTEQVLKEAGKKGFSEKALSEAMRRVTGKGRVGVTPAEAQRLLRRPQEGVLEPIPEIFLETIPKAPYELLEMSAIPEIGRPISTATQRIEAHQVARTKGLIAPTGKMRQGYRRLAKAVTGKTTTTKMTEDEADLFILSLDRLVTKGGRPAKIPVNAGLITKEFADKIPLLQEIGAKERLRPSLMVFRKMGLEEEVFWSTFEKEALFGEELLTLERNIFNLAKNVSKEGRRRVFRAIESPDEAIAMTPQEERAIVELRKFFDDWANKLELPMDKRRQNYVTHIFEKAIEGDIVAEKGLDAELIKALDFITPKNIFMPFLEKRLGRTLGLKEDPFLAAMAYGRRALRKYHYEPLIRRIRVYTNYLPPNSTRYLKSYINRITGRPLQIDREMNHTVREFAQAISKLPGGKGLANTLMQGDVAGLAAYNYTSLLYTMWLGYKPTSAIRNLGQHSLIIADVGPKMFAEGIRLRFTAEGKAALRESLVLRSRARGYMPGIDASFVGRYSDAVRENALAMFRLADKQNVSDAFLSGYAEAKGLGLPHKIAVKRGDEVAAHTQFLYTRMAGAEWSQSSLGRVMSPLTTWPMNWLELMTRWIGNKPSAVYEVYGVEVGTKVAQMSWSTRRKSILLYLALVGSAYAVEAKTKVRATEYTGWTSMRYLKDIATGKLPGLAIPGAFAELIYGVLTGDERSLKSGWSKVRPDYSVGIIRILDRIFKGEADWMSLFIYLNPEQSEKEGPKTKITESSADILKRTKAAPLLGAGLMKKSSADILKQTGR